jgi:uncharacterized membrane protein
LQNLLKDTLFARKYFHKAEVYLIVVLLVFGLSICFLLPVGGGYDEETHLARVWEMSAFVFVPNEKLGAEMPFPAIYWEMSYRRPFIVRAVEPDFWEKYGDLQLDAHDYIYRGVETRSVYSPPLLLPQALVMRYFGRSQQWSALTVFYLCRLIGLVSFLALAWFAVRIIPFGKWILAILATSPVAVLQASTVSADAISNGIALLFIAGTLAIANRREIRWRDWMAMSLLFLILFWGKLNIVPLAILPFLVLKPSQFKIRFGYVTLLITAICLCLLEVFGWSALAYSRLYTAPEGTDPLGQIQFILSNPLKTSAVLVHDIRANGFDYLRAWIAIYGYSYWPVPVWTYYLFAVGLLAGLFLREGDNGMEKKTRIGLIAAFVVAYLATILSMYINFNPVGSEQIADVQGRYFVTVMPLLFLALARLPFTKRIQMPASLPVALGVASLLIYIAGMHLSYHVTCGSQFYQPGLCYQPNYKNWAPNERYSPPVSEQLTLSQEIVAECDGMTSLRIWVNAENSDTGGTTEFHLWDVHEKLDMSRVNAPNSSLPSGGWYTLNFQPDWSSNGKFYLLTIRSENDGPRIAYSLRPEYADGKLYENDQAVEQDILFQTGCTAGWDKVRQTGSP